MHKAASINARLVCTTLVSLSVSFASRAQTIDGSLAAELNIGADGVSAQAVFAGSAGVGIPLPGIALGVAPGEPVLIVNTDLNVVTVVGGAIESATGGVIPDGAAQSVIRAGLSGGDVVQVIANQAAGIVAEAVQRQSGGFVPASATRTVLATAINGGDVGDAIELVAFDLVANEATRLLAGEVGRAVQDAVVGFVDADTIEELFNGAIRGQDLEPLFRDAIRRRTGEL
ncbi:MAG: hypothetical protein ACR2QZ_03580 [Woeseiaceae bacterium]